MVETYKNKSELKPCEEDLLYLKKLIETKSNDKYLDKELFILIFYLNIKMHFQYFNQVFIS